MLIIPVLVGLTSFAETEYHTQSRYALQREVGFVQKHNKYTVLWRWQVATIIPPDQRHRLRPL